MGVGAIVGGIVAVGIGDAARVRVLDGTGAVVGVLAGITTGVAVSPGEGVAGAVDVGTGSVGIGGTGVTVVPAGAGNGVKVGGGKAVGCVGTGVLDGITGISVGSAIDVAVAVTSGSSVEHATKSNRAESTPAIQKILIAVDI